VLGLVEDAGPAQAAGLVAVGAQGLVDRLDRHSSVLGDGSQCGLLLGGCGGQLTTSRIPTGCHPLPGESLPPLARSLGLNTNGPDSSRM
jgi:hypothetical protein